MKEEETDLSFLDFDDTNRHPGGSQAALARSPPPNEQSPHA
jgi:hypothetical protein